MWKILQYHLITSAQNFKACSQADLPSPHRPQAYFQPSEKKSFLKDNKVKVFKQPSQSPDLQPTKNVWEELKTHERAGRPRNLTQLKQFCQGD